MKVLLIGRWGKTHALGKALAKSKDVVLHSLMDKKNNGIAEISRHYALCDIRNVNEIEKYVIEHKIEMIVVVPELALEQDITTYFIEKGIPCVGPTEFCTKLEADKGFVRKLMEEFNIDASPVFKVFDDKAEATGYIRSCSFPVAVKPAGITEGDGVKVMGIQIEGRDEAARYVEEVFDRSIGELPGVVIEEKIRGEEYTLQFFCDGEHVIPMPAVRDYKLLEEGDRGLNTPGMGSYSCADHMLPFLSRQDFEKSVTIIKRILDALKEKHNEKFKGFLSGQYMLTADGVKLIEINVRPGDSEILNMVPILGTDFLQICMSIYEGSLDEAGISFEEKATVCKYAVPEGFPTPSGNVAVQIDRKRIGQIGAHLFQSCFEAGEGIYEPSPRLFAITGTGDTLAEAYENCEEGLSCIRGDRIFHRKDIGTPELTGAYKRFNFINR